MAIGLLIQKTAVKLLALVLALAAVAGTGWYVGHLRQEVREAQEAARIAQEGLAKLQATYAYRDRLRRASEARKALADASLTGALEQAQPWAETPVPEGVQNSVCLYIDCSGNSADAGLRDESHGSP